MALPLYQLDRDDRAGITRGPGDLQTSVGVALIARPTWGVAADVTASWPTGDDAADLGMGHVMVMPSIGAWSRALAPVLDRLADELADRFTLAKLNTDEAQDIGARYGIRSIPTLMVFRDGKEVARQAGAMDAATLRRWLEANAGVRG